jgi:RNA polymerase sigma factor (sigma-70 family)
MRDTAVVESIVAGDSGGLAAAYDEYADLIYAYCRAIIGNPQETADAVQGTFVNAAANAHRLNDPSQLRAWLFALARNQCMHGRHDSEAAAAALDTGALSITAGTDDDRDVLRAAIDGLSTDERDILGLLWHGLDVDEAALVLGLSRNEAYDRFSAARDQLEASVLALVVCNHGREDCLDLDELLGDWDGEFTERLRSKIVGHIEGCDACGECRDRELRPALLLNLTPGALLGAAEEARAMTRPAPEWLRDRLLWLVTTDDASAETERRAMDKRLGPFSNTGFPKRRRTTRTLPAGRTRVRLALAVGGGVAVAAAIAALVVIPGGTSPSARTGAATEAGAGTAMSPGGAVTPDTGASATPTISPSGAGRTSPAAHRSSSPSPSNTIAPANTQTPLAKPSKAAPASGAISLSTSSITVGTLFGSSVTLTAEGGPVTWSVAIPSAAAGQLAVSPTSGTLSAGQSVSIAVAAKNANNYRTTLTFSPGGHAVAVTVGLG